MLPSRMTWTGFFRSWGSRRSRAVATVAALAFSSVMVVSLLVPSGTGKKVSRTRLSVPALSQTTS